MSKRKQSSQATLNINTGEVIEYPPHVTRFRHQFNAKSFPSDHEKRRTPSQTIPDQTMSLSEILKRYTKGISFDDLSSGRVQLWSGDGDDFSLDISHLDKADQEQFKADAREELENLRQSLHDKAVSLKAQKKSKEQKRSPNNADQGDKATQGNNPDPDKNSAGGDTQKGSTDNKKS